MCLLGRGQGRHGSDAGEELRLLWEEGWGREDLAGFPRPRELATCAPAFLAVDGHRPWCGHHFLLRPNHWAMFLWFDFGGCLPSLPPPRVPGGSRLPSHH